MSYTVKYNQEKNCIMVAVHGKLNLPLLKDIAFDVSKTIDETGCKFILNDLRGASPAKEAFDIYSMPEASKMAGIARTVKRALIVGNRGEDFHFLQTVFVNQGNSVKMFANMDDAEVWLLGT